MKKIYKSLGLSIVIAFTMSITPILSTSNSSNINVIEAASKKTFKTFTVNSVYSSSTKITGKGTKGATVKAYVSGKQIGKSTVSSSGSYTIKISKKKKNTKITLKRMKMQTQQLSQPIQIFPLTNLSVRAELSNFLVFITRFQA